MRVTRCSASAIKTYRHCQFKYYLQYILKLPSLSGKAALQGSIVHQVFEWMGQLKMRGKTNVDPMWLLDRAWDELLPKNPHVAIRRTTSRGEAADFKKCRLAVETILDSKYNLYELDIIKIEEWFCLEMPGDGWRAKDENGEYRQFAVRGYIDLTHIINEDTIEIVDWKTGKRSDFYSMKEQTHDTLMQDIQLRIYHLAVATLYPQYKNIIATFYYTGDGGPITVALTNDEIPETIDILWKFFSQVKKDILILRNRSFKCKMCSFDKKGVCHKIWSDLSAFGTEYIELQYCEKKQKTK